MYKPIPHHIESERLILSLVTPSDLPDLYSINTDDAVTRYLPYESWKSFADAEAWLGRHDKRHRERESYQCAIRLRDSGRTIGNCLVFRFDTTAACAEVGYLLGREYWGQGYMQEALRLWIAFAFNRLGLRRLEAEIDARNDASARVLERCGFEREGFARQRWADKNELSDSAYYGLLNPDYQPVDTLALLFEEVPPTPGRLIAFSDLAPSAVADRPAAERAIGPAPLRLTTERYAGEDGALSMGDWECEPGAWSIAFHPHRHEFFQILEGCLEIAGEDGVARRFGPGDACVIPAGFRGEFRVLERVRKRYVMFDR